MIGLVLLAALMANESTPQAWIDQLRQADRLAAENRSGDAETAYIGARKKAEQSGADELSVAITLNHLGRCYQSWGRLRDAGRVYAAALTIVERTFGVASDNGVQFAIDLSNTYLELDQVSQAESLIRPFLGRSNMLSPSNRAILLAELASVLVHKKKYLAAKSLYLEALPLFERDPRREFRERTIIALSNLSTLHMQMNRFAEGRMYSDRAQALLGTIADAPVVLVFKTTANAAAISWQSGKPEEADFLFQTAIRLCENTLGHDHYLLGDVMMNYAEFLRTVGRRRDAKLARNRAKAILASFGRENLVGLTVDATAFR